MSDQEELERYRYLQLKQKMASAAPAPVQSQGPDMSGSFPEARNLASSDVSLGQKAWQALQIPQQMSQRGLTSIAQTMPNPEPVGYNQKTNMSLQTPVGPMNFPVPTDVVNAAPRIAAETMAQAAPQFVSRGAIVGSALGKAAQSVMPMVSRLASGVAGQAESLTGAAPGSLAAAYKDPSLMFSQGKGAAGPIYEAAKSAASPMANLFKGMPKNADIVDKTIDYISKGGTLEPTEALTARKAIDAMLPSRTYSKDVLLGLRGEVDKMAKASPTLSAADAAYQRGIQAQSLRNLFPQNKYGGTSAFKTGIIAALSNLGASGKVASMMMSPAVAGTMATAAGAAAPLASGVAENPATTAAIAQLLKQLKDKYDQRRLP
jgi:hypothetical protein